MDVHDVGAYRIEDKDRPLKHRDGVDNRAWALHFTR